MNPAPSNSSVEIPAPTARTATGGQKTILIILDGLSDQIAQQAMGYLHGLIAAGLARHSAMQCELPSMSRPLYETILTGKTPIESGITVNQVVRLSHHRSIFHYAREAGLTTAACAYHWFSELYNQSPYDMLRHRHQHDDSKPIQHGIFYHQDHYPDEALFQDAEYLRTAFDPDFLLIHPMNIDDTGHKFGGDSPNYLRAARHADMIMGYFLPAWLAAGYQIFVTADHGMNWDKTHGGTAEVERLVPFYAIGDQALSVTPEQPLQTAIIGYVRATLRC